MKNTSTQNLLKVLSAIILLAFTGLAQGAPIVGVDFVSTTGFSNISSLGADRVSHTATVLADGKVLVAGGASTGSWATAELFNPVTRSWSATGSMANQRDYHTATLLPNGKVLVVGGIFADVSLKSAELYNPVTKTWSSAGNLTRSRFAHQAVVLPNGKVLVIGGRDFNATTTPWVDNTLQSVELYDPATNSWSAAPSMAVGRNLFTATMLANGKILVAGGYTETGFNPAAEIYDPVANSWSGAGSLSVGRYNHTATLLLNGKVLIAGGYGDPGPQATAELYSPATNSWSGAGSFDTACFNHAAVLLSNGNVLISGGNASNSITASASIYNPTANIWTAAPSLNNARREHTATALADGSVLIVGGYGEPGYMTSVERYATTEAGLSAAEGALGTQTGTFSDPNGNATVILTASSGSVTQDNAAGTWSWSGTGADGPTNNDIVITATNTASATATAHFSFLVTNVPPSVSITGNAAPEVGESVTFTFTATDASSADQAAGFAWSVDYGDGSAVVTVPAGAASPLELSHIYTSANHSVLLATATDKDSGASATAILDINPGAKAPTITTPTVAFLISTATTLGGTVTSDGGSNITERGVVYSITTENADPIIGDAGVTKFPCDGTTGVFTVDVTGLVLGAGYSFKAFATNAGGTSYTSVSTFIAISNNVPVLTVNASASGMVPTTVVNFVPGGNPALNKGIRPQGSLVIAGPDRYYYGTTAEGGAFGCGTIFRLTPEGEQTVLVSFTGTNGANRGKSPLGSLVEGSDGELYGTTSSGGSSNMGTVFKVTLEGVLTTLVNFTGSNGANPGAVPTGDLVQLNDEEFYGMTSQGGTGNSGTIFKVTMTGVRTTVINFTGTSGANPGKAPMGSLLDGSDGSFYGMTSTGGSANAGTLFKLTEDGTRMTLVTFGTVPNSGRLPLGSLADGGAEYFYGMTSQGGTGKAGTIFRVTREGEFSTLVNFTNASGANLGGFPSGSLVPAYDGNIYGMTTQGGTTNMGTIFKMTSEGVLTTQATFTGESGENPGQRPLGSLIQADDDSFYGMTSLGGTSNAGTVFRLAMPLPGVKVVEGSANPVVTGTFSDGDGNESVTLTASSGAITHDNAAGTWSWTGDATDGLVNSTITITATDTAGSVVTTPFAFIVTNALPIVAITGPPTAKAGTLSTFNLTATDISTVDQAAGFTWYVDYSDGTSGSYLPAGTTTPQAVNHYFPAAGTFTVYATATDKDGGRGVSNMIDVVVSAPDLTVSGNSIAIINGDDSPASEDQTDFGNTLPNSGSVVRTFTIKNVGTTSLPVAAVTVADSSNGVPGASDFTITQQPVSPLAKGASQTFKVTFQPSEEGQRGARIVLSYASGAGHFEFVVWGNGANSAPTDITLSTASIPENNEVDALVGTLTAVDPDSGQTFTFGLAEGEGGDDNDSFTIEDNNLKMTAVADYETKSVYHLRVSASDDLGGVFEKALVVTVTDVAELPQVSDIADVSIEEDASAGPYAFTVTDGGPAATVSITSSNVALVKPANVTVEGSGADYSLTINPVANSFGTATITVRVSNGDLTGTTSFELTVVPVNDAPSFKLPSDAIGQAGVTWTAVDDPNLSWTGIASSADGTRLAATTEGDQIYVSNDAGVTWTPRATVQNWVGIAASADGKKLAAVVAMGQIYTTTNGGISWTAQDSARNWTCIASSADGTKLAAAVDNGVIYTSTNAGLKWTAQAPSGSHHWKSIASSADGSKLAAVDFGGQIYTSSNAGVKWTAQPSAGFRGWTGITCSADGVKVAAVARDVNGEYIYTSKDSGLTWKARATAGEWKGITSSADGMKLAAINISGISTSSDGGVSWWDQDGGGSEWAGIASSADGTRLAAVESVGLIHLSLGDPIPFFMGVLADSGPSSTAKVVSQLVAGPANESGQVVTLLVETDDESLFTVPPAISANGTLTFTPGSNPGIATVTVTAMDDGGTDDGGVDTSEPQSFAINIGETLLPHIAVEQYPDTPLASGDSMDLGTLGTNLVKPFTFTIRNTGDASLTGIVATVTGADASMFTITKAAETSLVPLDYTTFILQAKLTSVGDKNATLKIASNDPDVASYEISLTAAGLAPSLPVVTTSAADQDSIDTVSAGLAGTVNSKGIERQVFIDYGLTKDYGYTIMGSPETVSSEDGAEDVSAVVEGLVPHTTYHFRVRAVSDLGSASGLDRTFTTHTNFPVVGDMTVSVCPGAVATIDPFANDNAQDEDGDKLTITGKPVIDTSSAGTVSVVANKIVFTPKSGFIDPAMITYMVTDGFGGTIEAYLTVNPGSVSTQEEVTYPAAFATYTDLTFDTDAFWTATEKVSWLSISPASGFGSGTLSIKLQPNTSVTERSGTINIGGTIVTIHQSGVEAPSISLAEEGPFETIIGDSAFSLQIVTVNAPVTYTVTGKLPPGISLNQDTGIFSGAPSKSGSFPGIKVTAKNAKGSAPDSVTFTINVAALPVGAIGTFNGLIDPSDSAYLTADAGLGARFEMITTATGSASGKVIEGTTSKAFIGKIVSTVTDPNHPAVIGSITGTPFAVNLTIDATKNALVNSDDMHSVMRDSTGSLSATIHAWRNAWSAKAPIRLATAYKALHTFAIENTTDGGPDGYGYGSFTVADTTGAFTMAGKLADGNGLTGSSFIGQNGEVLIYQTLYSNHGTCLGQLTVTPGASAPANNAVAGTLTWLKPASSAKAKDTVYAEGFGPLTLNVAGSAYNIPAKGQLVMGLLPAAPAATGWNAQLDFSLGGLDTEGKEFYQLLRITNPSSIGLTNTAAFPVYNAAGSPNPNLYKVAMPTLTPATGLFTGTYTIPGSSKPLDRTPTYYGQIVRIIGVPPTPTTTRGYGYFLLPKVPVGSQTVKTSPALSGAVLLEAAP